MPAANLFMFVACLCPKGVKTPSFGGQGRALVSLGRMLHSCDLISFYVCLEMQNLYILHTAAGGLVLYTQALDSTTLKGWGY